MASCEEIHAELALLQPDVLAIVHAFKIAVLTNKTLLK